MPPLNGPECQEPGCYSRTREGKPYCPKHLDRMPYVAEVIKEHSARAWEAEHGPNRTSHYSRDILLLLPSTTEGISRKIGIKEAIVHRIVKLMQREKLVRLGKTRRGNITVEAR